MEIPSFYWFLDVFGVVTRSPRWFSDVPVSPHGLFIARRRSTARRLTPLSEVDSVLRSTLPTMTLDESYAAKEKMVEEILPSAARD